MFYSIDYWALYGQGGGQLYCTERKVVSNPPSHLILAPDKVKMQKKQLIECVPNFSEGRDAAVIKQITDAIQTVEGIRLLDVDPGIISIQIYFTTKCTILTALLVTHDVKERQPIVRS